MNYDVSVIVPIYNGEKYIENCYNCLKKQTLENIEIIFVNDGSIDNTLNIIKSLSQSDKSVVALTQENKGVSVARNSGINHASGQYVGFVDVDDEIELDMYESLFSFAKENNLDIVSMDNLGKPNEKTIITKKEEAISLLFLAKISMSSCNKIFRKSMLSKTNAPFLPGKRINEDLMAVYNAIGLSDRVGIINANKYHYIRREGSSSRASRFSEKYFDAIEIANLIYNDSIIKYPKLKEESEARKAKTYLRIIKIFYLRGAPKEYKTQINELRKFLKGVPFNIISAYFRKSDQIRYFLYLYAKPLFIVLLKTIDRK